MSKNQVKDLQDFREGQTVNIDGIKHMQGVVITRISQSGIEITGKDCGELIISCKSPATLADKQRAVDIKIDPHTQRQTVKVARVVATEQDIDSDTNDTGEPRERVSRGTYSSKMDNLDFPKDTFTAQQLADLNDIPYIYAAAYCKEYLEEAGFAERKEGQRGKSAKLFKIG